MASLISGTLTNLGLPAVLPTPSPSDKRSELAHAKTQCLVSFIHYSIIVSENANWYGIAAPAGGNEASYNVSTQILVLVYVTGWWIKLALSPRNIDTEQHSPHLNNYTIAFNNNNNGTNFSSYFFISLIIKKNYL